MTLGAPALGGLCLFGVLALAAWLLRQRKRGSPLLLAAALLAAVAAARPLVRLGGGPRLRVLILDASGSFARALEPLRESLSRVGEDLDGEDRLALILFADEPRLAIPPTPPGAFPAALARLELPSATPGGSAIAAALQAGLALDADGRGREILLISDGLEDRGDLRLAGLDAASRGSPIHAYCPPLAAARDAAILSLSAPERSAPGLAVEVELRLRSAVNCAAVLEIEARREGTEARVWSRRLELSLPGGATLVRSVSEALPSKGVYKIEARLRTDITDELWPENNRAEAWVQVGDGGLAWVVSARPRWGLELARRAGFQPRAIAPSELAAALRDPRAPQLLLIDDIPATVLEPVSGALRALVKDGGAGLCVLGGRSSFGPGGYAGTAFEQLLPLRSAPPGDEARSLALALAVDASGSMSEEYPRALSEGIEPRLELLRPGDQAAIAAFADGRRAGRGLAPGPLTKELAALKALEPEGGTDLIRALSEDVLAVLAQAPPGSARLGFLVTDGQARVTPEALSALAARASALVGEPPARIFLVLIGGDAAGLEALKSLAGGIDGPRCRGRALRLSQAGGELGELLEEAAAEGREELRAGRFRARVSAAGRSRGLAAPAAPITGYLRTRLAEDAELLASVGPEDRPEDDTEPLCARAERDLGASVAFTGSLEAWSSEAWTASADGRAFLAALPGLARPRFQDGVSLTARRPGRSLVLELERSDGGLGVASAQVLDERGAELGAPIALVPEAPGLFRARRRAPIGAARVRFSLNGEGVGMRGLPPPGAGELRRAEPDLEALQALAEASGGRWLAGLPRVSAPLEGEGAAGARSLSPWLAAAAALALFGSVLRGLTGLRAAPSSRAWPSSVIPERSRRSGT